MLGTSPDTMGGVASVVRIYRSREFFSRWPVTYLVSHADGGPIRKLLKALVAWSVFAGWLFGKRKFILHVHCASRASFWRKTAFILPAAWTGRMVVFHLHGGEFMQFYHEECGFLAKAVVRYVLKSCTRIIVLSESWRKDIASVTKNGAIDVIANPALPLRGVPAATMRKPDMLLFLGRLGRAKGIHVLLDALMVVKRDHASVRLVCGGDGDLDEVRGIVNKLGLVDRVEILGWVDEARRSELLATATMFVLPSYAEGLPMSILEAMSAGLPIVTTPVGGIPEAITDGEEGLLVPVGDVEALSAAICRLLGDEQLREAMGSRGRAKFDACYDADVVLPRLESVYRELGVLPTGLT